MHGFHASDRPCSYGLAMHLVSVGLAAVMLGVALAIS